jgi:predicted nucleic acid-binding protein
MREVILDTDMLSEILKGVDPIIERHKSAYDDKFQKLSFTSASVMEILTGLRKRGAVAQQQRAATLFSQNSEILPDYLDYRLAADINGDLLRQGLVIGIVDPLIAACAIRRGFGVATGNIKHFDFIRRAGYDFHLENWRDLGLSI